MEGGQSLVREASLSPEPQAMAALLSGESLGGQLLGCCCCYG